MLWHENAVAYLRKWWLLELSNFCNCVQHPWKLTSRDFWSSRNKRKPLSKLKHVFRKFSGVSHKQCMLEFSNLCNCVQHPWKLTSRDFWSSRNERKPLSKQKCVLRKCWEVSEKWWMPRAFKHVAIVFSTSENLLVGISGGSTNKRKPPSKQKYVLLRKLHVGYLINSAC